MGESRSPKRWKLKRFKVAFSWFLFYSISFHQHLIAKWITTRTAKVLSAWPQWPGVFSSPSRRLVLPSPQWTASSWMLLPGMIKFFLPRSLLPLSSSDAGPSFLGSISSQLLCCFSRINVWDPAWQTQCMFSPHLTNGLNGNEILRWKHFPGDLVF